MASSQIPYATEQGILDATSGKESPLWIKNREFHLAVAVE
jgi:hypothetical protein